MANERWAKREILNAVHENNLEIFLRSIGALDEIQAGLHRCKFCQKQITMDNFGAVFPKDQAIHLVCDLPSCLGSICFSE